MSTHKFKVGDKVRIVGHEDIPPTTCVRKFRDEIGYIKSVEGVASRGQWYYLEGIHRERGVYEGELESVKSSRVEVGQQRITKRLKEIWNIISLDWKMGEYKCQMVGSNYIWYGTEDMIEEKSDLYIPTPR